MDITPKKCCLRYDPPTLILYYEMNKNGKIHRRSIPIREKETKKADQILKDLLNGTHHEKYLKVFSNSQLKRLLKKLVDGEQGLHINLAEQKSQLNFDVEKTDLNKLDDKTLNVVKEKMNESFEKNKVKPGDKQWQYDIEVDFDNDIDGQIEGSAWDDEDESDLEF